MAFNLATALNLLRIVPAVIAKAPEFVETFEQAVQVLHPGDQDTAKEALADIQADNDEGFQRLDAKLEAAKNR